jgi:hypothetical protein
MFYNFPPQFTEAPWGLPTSEAMWVLVEDITHLSKQDLGGQKLRSIAGCASEVEAAVSLI